MHRAYSLGVMNFRYFPSRLRVTFAVALSASVAALSGCMDTDPALKEHFAERSTEPTGIKMPKFDSPDLPSAVVPTPKNEKRDPNNPCALDATTVAACLPLTTALADLGPSTAVVATEDGNLYIVEPGKTPRLLANVGTAVRQILVSPSVTEDGQIFVLRADSTVARVTVFPATVHAPEPAEVRELPDVTEVGIIAIYFDDHGNLKKLLAGDPGIDIRSICHGPGNMPLLATAKLDGIPQLVQWVDGWIEPLGGVDLANDIAGCTVIGDHVAIAIPEAQKVVSVPIKPSAGLAPHGPSAHKKWELAGSPTTLVDGDFGRISHLAAVAGTHGFELWGATTNKSPEIAESRQSSESDERVIRLPSDGKAGASPD